MADYYADEVQALVEPLEQRVAELHAALKEAWKQLYAAATLATVPESVDWPMVAEDCMGAANTAERVLLKGNDLGSR